jgi:hypothetical protein
MFLSSPHERKLRIVLALCGLLGIIFFHPFVTLGCVILLALLSGGVEAISLGLLMDFAWQPIALLHPLPLFLIAGIAITWLFEPVRTRFLR